MVAIDEGTEGLTLGRFSNPVNLVWTRERLSQTKDCQEKAKDCQGPHQQSEAFRRVNENQSRCKIDQQRRHLNENESRRIRIEGQTFDQRYRRCSNATRVSERKKLDSSH